MRRPSGGVTSVAPSTPVALRYDLDSQGFSPPSPLSYFVAGVKPAFMVLSFFYRLDTRSVQGTVAAWHGVCFLLRAMLRQIGFGATDTVIRDCRSANEENLARIDYSDLLALAEELGLLDVQRGVDSFARAGLVP
jgi:hypothetical protein